MKITTKNYVAVSDKYKDGLPEGLAWSHAYLLGETNEGKNWDRYKSDAKFKKVADLAFQKLEEYIASKANKRVATSNAKSQPNTRYSKYANIDIECRFIERFLGFHDQVLYKNTFGVFIDELQTAISNHKITKKSPVAKEIMQIQEAVIRQFNTMYNAAHFVLKPATIKHLKGILEKKENAYTDINEDYVKSKRDSMPLEGLQAAPAINIMPSSEFASLQFKTIGFRDRWLNFIGDPSPGFKAMVYGMPKMGKSYLCIDFASYLSKNHGKVLYVSKEEFMSPTLQQKIRDKQATNPNLFLANETPADLTSYGFVFLDSVTSLKLDPDDLKALEAKYPGVSFIYVFQVTKAGSARGTNEFMHNVDVVIEIRERGIAIQNGRFNQGGTLKIFEAEPTLEENNEVPALAGVNKNRREKGHKKDLAIRFRIDQNFNSLFRDASVVSLTDLSTRMPDSWEDTAAMNLQIQPFLDKLPRINATDYKFGDSPLDELPKELQGKIFVLNLKSRSYFVNTEGYSYARYVLRLDNYSPGGLNGSNRKDRSSNKDWTELEWLDESDRRLLREIKKMVGKGDMQAAMDLAQRGDTVIREAIPSEIWEKMSGTVLKSKSTRQPRELDNKTEVKEKNRRYLPWTMGVRVLNDIFLNQMGNEYEGDFTEVLADAVQKNDLIELELNKLEHALAKILPELYRAADERDTKEK